MILGPYRDLVAVGSGGMGAVFRGRAPDGRDVAIKVLTRVDAATRSRFEREKRLLGAFGEREGFVPLLDAGESPGGPYLVMPFIGGGTLRERLARGALGVEPTVALGEALASALGRAHERGIVHRDLKPENVLFTLDGRPLIADLGLAKHFDRGASGASQSASMSAHGVLRGTAGYMPPEQMTDSKSAGPPADVFALGAILYECLAGQPAFAGATPLEILSNASASSWRPLSVAAPAAPAWLASVVERALARAPTDRFPDGHALRHAFAPGERIRRGSRLVPGVLAIACVASGLLLARTWQPTASPLSGRSATDLAGLAEEKLRKGDVDGAIEDATAAIRLDPGRAGAWVVRGVARQKRRDHRGAIEDSSRAIELDPKLAEAWQTRGTARGDLSDRPGALDDLNRAIQLAPGFAEAWCNRGIMRNLGDDHEGAIADATRAIELAPGLAPAWRGRAAARGKLGEIREAVLDATRAIELDPRDPLAWMIRAAERNKDGDSKGAIEDATRAIELAPLEPWAWKTRAEVRERARDSREAIEDATRAIEIDPRMAEAWGVRASAREGAGDHHGAIGDATRAIELDPKLARVWMVRGFARSATLDDGAIEDNTRAVELDPKLAQAWAGRGVARAAKGDHAGAISDDTRAIELDPALVWVWENRATERSNVRDYDGAIEDANRALALAPASPMAWLVRGTARDGKNDHAGAIQDYRRFLELAPEHPQAQGVRDLLAKNWGR